MDYTILRNITPLPSFVFNTQRRFDLPKNPSIDYVNPGIGFVTKIFDFYVPLYSQNYSYAIEKKDNDGDEIINDIIDAEKQAGKGEPENIAEAIDESNNVERDQNESVQSSNKNKKRLDDGIFESFMHPKIKTAKIEFNSEKKISKIKNNGNKSVKHKFNIV